MRGRLSIALFLALCLGLVTSACAQDDPVITVESGGQEEDHGEGHEDQGTKEIAGEEATYHGTTDVTGTSELELEADDFYFGPTVLDGDAGQQLTLSLHNEGDAPHTLTTDDGVDVEMDPGGTATVDVTFPDSGALVFYCRFHRGQGMLGALSVDGSLDAGSSGSSGGSDYEY
jgi:plastocyanin